MCVNTKVTYNIIDSNKYLTIRDVVIILVGPSVQNKEHPNI